MAQLIYSTIASLDGYIADEERRFDWSAPDEEVHAFVNELMRPVGTHLYGRRIYEVLVAWETMPTETEPAVISDFQQIWRSADKIVYSRTLSQPSSAKTRIEREFRPEQVRRLLSYASRDVLIGGSELGAQAFAAGLVDECHLLLAPVVVGAGVRALPERQHLTLALRDVHRFASGFVHLHYAVRR
jgi:dihydrofolate reductase